MKIIFVLVLIFVAFLTLRLSNKTTNEKEFTLAGRNLTAFQVASVIIGTLVGGASTVGTVQLAYEYGIAAWLFTLGSGIACLILGIFFSVALRKHEVVTVTELMGQYFGQKFRLFTSFLTSLGMFIHVIAQYIASSAILMSIFPLNIEQSTIIIAICFLLITVKGGMHGSTIIGVTKVTFLYLLTIVSCVIVFYKGGISTFFKPALISYWNFNIYGNSKAFIELIFMIIGVTSTQTYLQAIFSAKTIKEAKKGAFIAAALIPPIGLMGVFIGIFLKINHPEIAYDTSLALPFFINTYFNPLLSSVFLSFIFIIILGTGSGLILGFTTNIYNDFISGLSLLKNIRGLTLIRATSFFAIIFSMLIVILNLNDEILQWSFLSMGLRGVSVFLPLCFIVFWGYNLSDWMKRLIFLPIIFYILYILKIVL